MLKAVLNLKDYMLKTPYERILDEATSDDTIICPLNLLMQVAQGTMFYEGYQICKAHLWSIIKNRNISWKRLSKTLNLLEYLLINGSEDIGYEFKEEIFYINLLKDFQAMENNEDKGIIIREKTNCIMTLLEDEEKLKKEREEVQKIKERVSGISSDGKILKNINNTQKNQHSVSATIQEKPKEENNKPNADFNDFRNFGQPVTKTEANNWANWSTFNTWEGESKKPKSETTIVQNTKIINAPINPFENINKIEIKNQSVKKEIVADLLDLDYVEVNKNVEAKPQNPNQVWTPFDQNQTIGNNPWTSAQNQNWNLAPVNFTANSVGISANVQTTPNVNQEIKKSKENDQIYKQFTPMESNLVNLKEIANDDRAWNWKREQEAKAQANNNQNLLYTNQKDLDSFFI